MKKLFLIAGLTLAILCIKGQPKQTVKDVRTKYVISKQVPDTTTVHQGSKGGVYILRRSGKTQKLYKYYLNLK